jgi:hypothetical protein
MLLTHADGLLCIQLHTVGYRFFLALKGFPFTSTLFILIAQSQADIALKSLQFYHDTVYF